MTENEFSDFQMRLAALLRCRPPGTLARFTPFAGAYWTGHELKGIFIGVDGDGSEQLDEEYDLPLGWDGALADFKEWLASPRFEHQSTISDWIERGVA